MPYPRVAWFIGTVGSTAFNRGPFISSHTG